MLRRWIVIAFFSIASVSLYFAIWRIAEWQLDTAWRNHIVTEQADLKFIGDAAKDKLMGVYGGLRNISLLPSVRNADRNNKQLSADSIANIQQLYNGLKSQLDLSEIYILPVTFNPRRIDPQTGKFEEPLVVFDELIVHGGKFAKLDNPFQVPKISDGQSGEEEIEGAEYDAMVEQLAWFLKTNPVQRAGLVLKPPMLSSDDVITCDNTVYNTTLNDEDRLGVIFSVPFYGFDGKLRGMVSAILRKNIIASFADEDTHSIKSPFNSRKNARTDSNELAYDTFTPTLTGADAQQSLVMRYAIDIQDSVGTWILENNEKSAEFYTSPVYREIRSFAVWSYLALTMAICLASVVYVAHIRRSAVLQFAATHDALTGLPNRTVVEKQIDLSLRSRSNSTQNSNALFYLDLDKFKLVNDTMGHHVGDEVLQHAARVLRDLAGKTDVVARIGGDEFVIIVTGVKSSEQIIGLAKRINAEMKLPIQIGGQTILIGTSIGIALIDGNVNSADEVLRQADLALFRTKSEERGNFRFYESAMDADRERRRLLEFDLQSGIRNSEFVLHYQAIHNTASGEISGYEALVRWNHPKRGLVPPLSFIPVAEETGMINELGEWIITQACTDAMKLPAHTRMAVNLSPVQFRNHALPLSILAILNKTGLEPKRLEVEVTESVLLNDDDLTINIMNQLRGIGIRIALDDFGTGYSSLSYLKSFEFDKVKIDRSFLSNIDDEKETVVLKAVTELSNSLGMTTVAEGVETVAQLNKVREQGCTEVQGYYFSKPMAIAELLSLENDPLAATAIA